MSLLACCVYDTEENDRLKYTKECFKSFLDTVDLSKHRWFIIDNNSCKEAKEFLKGYEKYATVIYNTENLGTARGINLAHKQRNPNEICWKFDNDITWDVNNWVDYGDEVFDNYENIGVCGLKRKDIWQSPNNPDPRYRTIMEGDIELSEDIIGTCTAYNPKLLDKVGYLVQFSTYSFDDNIMNVRSLTAGFRNCFLPWIDIEHLDEGNSECTEWKKQEAGFYLQEASIYMDKIKKGEISYYYDGN